MVVSRGEVLEKRRWEFQALYRAWLRAIAWAQKNPDDSADIIAAGIGRWLRDDDVVKRMQKGITWYDGPMNESFFGTTANPGPLAGTITGAIEIWAGFGKLQTSAKPNELISRGVLAGK